MSIISTYSTKICNKNRIFKHTIKEYRSAVEFFIDVTLKEWSAFSDLEHPNDSIAIMESMTHITETHPVVKYNFDSKFYKFPSYLRRAAIKDAVGRVTSYKTSLDKWEKSGLKSGKPGIPIAGYCFPVMYKGNMYIDDGDCNSRIKIYDGKTWDWLSITLKKSDVDYIEHHCSDMRKLSPSLVRRGKEWFLDFPFETPSGLNKTSVWDQTIVSVDLGINNACVCTVMKSDGMRSLALRHYSRQVFSAPSG